MDEDLAKEIFLTTESCVDSSPLIVISDENVTRFAEWGILFIIGILISASFVLRWRDESKKNFEISRLTEQLKEKERHCRRWATEYEKRVDENIKLLSENSIFRERNERQAERLRFFRGMGCPPPIEELEVDPE